MEEALLRVRDLTMMQAFNAPLVGARRVRESVRAGGGWGREVGVEESGQASWEHVVRDGGCL